MLLHLLNTSKETQEILNTIFPDLCYEATEPPKQGIIILDQNILEQVQKLRTTGFGNPIIGIIEHPAQLQDLPLVHLGKVQLIPRTDLPFKLPALIANTPELHREQCSPYLSGISINIESVFASLKNAQYSLKPLILCGNTGTGKQFIAEQLHKNSIYRERPFLAINLGLYSEETQRWAILKNALAEIPSGIQDTPEYLSGTVYIKILDNTDVLFIVSLLEWLSRIGDKNLFGPQIRIILGIEESVQELIPKEFLETFEIVLLPALTSHREDIPELLQWLIAHYNQRYYRHIQHISLSVLNHFMSRPWSGNIEELRYNLETVFLALPESTKTLTVEEA